MSNTPKLKRPVCITPSAYLSTTDEPNGYVIKKWKWKRIIQESKNEEKQHGLETTQSVNATVATSYMTSTAFLFVQICSIWNFCQGMLKSYTFVTRCIWRSNIHRILKLFLLLHIIKSIL